MPRNQAGGKGVESGWLALVTFHSCRHSGQRYDSVVALDVALFMKALPRADLHWGHCDFRRSSPSALASEMNGQ